MGLLSPEVVQEASMTSGRVQQYDHAVLPSITPVMTLACTVLSMLVCTMGVGLQITRLAISICHKIVPSLGSLGLSPE